jgi:hypothetical protein
MTDLDLCYLPATVAIELFKARKLSPVELMAAVIARHEATHQSINAFTFTYFDEAMELARKAEANYARGEPTGALEGLPVAIKDESYITGKPTSNGSLLMKDFVADKTHHGGGRHRPRPYRDAGVFLCRVYLVETVGGDTQSVEPRHDAGRLVRRLGGVARHRHLGRRHRL